MSRSKWREGIGGKILGEGRTMSRWLGRRWVEEGNGRYSASFLGDDLVAYDGKRYFNKAVSSDKRIEYA
jgi:hypothetical protein